MPIYFDKDTIANLVSYRDRIFALAQEVYSKYEIDILTNDTLSALSIHEIVSEYDPDYNTNFHRNEEDAKSNGMLIENKCATSKPNAKGIVGKSGWQFHAQGKLNSDRYIFAVRRKDNLQIVRLYDIVSTASVTVVQNCLAELKQKWIDRGKPNHDGLVVPEKLLLEQPIISKTKIRGCEVFKI